MKKYPGKLFIVRENENTDDEFFTVGEKIDEHACIGEKTKVAVYKLDHVATVETKIEVSVSGNKQ